MPACADQDGLLPRLRGDGLPFERFRRIIEKELRGVKEQCADLPSSSGPSGLQYVCPPCVGRMYDSPAALHAHLETAHSSRYHWMRGELVSPKVFSTRLSPLKLHNVMQMAGDLYNCGGPSLSLLLWDMWKLEEVVATPKWKTSPMRSTAELIKIWSLSSSMGGGLGTCTWAGSIWRKEAYRRVYSFI